MSGTPPPTPPLPPIHGGPSPVAGGTAPLPRWALLTIVGGAAVLGVGAVSIWHDRTASRAGHADAKPPVPGTALAFKPAPVEAPVPLPVATRQPIPPMPAPQRSFLPAIGGPDQEQIALNSPMRPIGPQQPAQHRQPPPGMEDAPAASQLVRDTAGGTELGKRLQPTLMQGSRASLLPHPDLTITMGTPMPCILDTAIDSTLPGMVVCRLPQTARGTTGRVDLLDRGTKIVGQIQSAPMQGQRRLFVLWTRAETPGGVIINLDSPGADRLGEAGVEGDYVTHFWERFGGAMMLSFLDTGLQSMALLASKGGAGQSFTSIQSNGGQVAAEALRGTINIPPTIHVNQGSEVVVFVARDLDFSGVYNLRTTR